ncbi:MAG: low molecular weight protein-tyrosine-phosphatase [Rhodanobacteraceae bacterium]
MTQPPPGVLFVCLGNICRSPTAEWVARAEFEKRGLRLPVASRGLGDWHVGQGADPRSLAAARDAGYDLSAHRARQFEDEDFGRFATVLAVDRATLSELRRRVPNGIPSPERFLVAAGLAPVEAGDSGDVADPYNGTPGDFRDALLLIRHGVLRLAERLLAAQGDDLADRASG